MLRLYAGAFATAFVDLEMIQSDALFDPEADPLPKREGAKSPASV
jgi:hypothetical protein